MLCSGQKSTVRWYRQHSIGIAAGDVSDTIIQWITQPSRRKLLCRAVTEFEGHVLFFRKLTDCQQIGAARQRNPERGFDMKERFEEITGAEQKTGDGGPLDALIEFYRAFNPPIWWAWKEPGSPGKVRAWTTLSDEIAGAMPSCSVAPPR